MSEIIFIDPKKLRAHEEVGADTVALVVEGIRDTGHFDMPLLVDRETLVVLDGHHRLAASLQLGFKRIPCYCVDYLRDDSIELESWRDDVTLTKQAVIDMGLSDGLYARKTTRHLYTLPDIDPVPLDDLLAAAG